LPSGCCFKGAGREGKPSPHRSWVPSPQQAPPPKEVSPRMPGRKYLPVQIRRLPPRLAPMATGDEEDKDARFLPEIRHLQELGYSPYKVWRTLHPQGLSRSRDPFRKWCLELVNSKKIPPWPQRDNRGRPKGRLKTSLDLLERFEDFQFEDAIRAALRPLVRFGTNSCFPPIALALGDDGLGVPRTIAGEPDFRRYALDLGHRRVRTIGDMDFYFMARWSKELREKIVQCEQDVDDLNVTALRMAREIRRQMLEAVKPTSRHRRKK